MVNMALSPAHIGGPGVTVSVGGLALTVTLAVAASGVLQFPRVTSFNVTSGLTPLTVTCTDPPSSRGTVLLGGVPSS